MEIKRRESENQYITPKQNVESNLSSRSNISQMDCSDGSERYLDIEFLQPNDLEISDHIEQQ